jgi:putative membrane protein
MEIFMTDTTDKMHQDFSHPKTLVQYLRIYLTGFAMGCADIVPGVSGGTIAFISGIYETLINAIKSFNLGALRKALKFDIGGFVDHTALRFLITLLVGIGTAILLLANVLSGLLENQPTFIFAFFAGLIFASILAIGITVKWSIDAIIAFAVAAVAAFVIVSLPALGDGDHSAITLFLSGAVAICAMILPGISGSFILLILGQYEYILNAVKNFRDFGNFIAVVVPVAVGCIIGIMIFSRVLSWTLKNYGNITIAVLTGFMLGSLKTIWDRAVEGVPIVNPSGALDGGQIVLVVILIAVGFVLVSLIDHMQSRNNPVMRLVMPKKPADPQPETAS